MATTNQMVDNQPMSRKRRVPAVAEFGYAVVKVAGSNVGRIRSTHRFFNSAMNACPATFYTVRRLAARAKSGDVVA